MSSLFSISRFIIHKIFQFNINIKSIGLFCFIVSHLLIGSRFCKYDFIHIFIQSKNFSFVFFEAPSITLSTFFKNLVSFGCNGTLMQTIIQFFIENIRLIVQFEIVSFDHVLNPIITIIICHSIMRIFVITLYF